MLLYYLGLLPFVHIPERFFICFLPTIINRYPQGSCFPSASSPRSPDASVLREIPHTSSPSSLAILKDSPQGPLKTVVLRKHS